MKYKVLIKEILRKVEEIEADSEKEALEIAEELYKDADIILDFDDLWDTEFEIYKDEQ